MAKKKESKFITMTELGRMFGVTRESVKEWAVKGKIPSTVNSQGSTVLLREESIAAAKKLRDQTAKKKTQDTINIHGELNKAKAVRESFNAKLARLNYEQKLKELIKVEVVEKKLFELALQVRDAILTVPNKISPELASMTDEKKINAFLDKTLRECLTTLSEGEFEKWRNKNFK